MPLTPQAELRTMILRVLQKAPSHGRSRASTLDHIDRRWGKSWSPEDLRAPKSRPFETNWRNRASYERARMVRDGLLVADADGSWRLSPQGQRVAQQLNDH